MEGKSKHGNRYRTLYERLVANTRLEDPEDPNSCWLWTAGVRSRYPCLTIWRNGGYATIAAHRAMLEQIHQVLFPFDEAGHLCANTLCINPSHLEIQAPAHNLADRRGYTFKGGNGARWIPVLFPIEDYMQEAANQAWDTPGKISKSCPF